MGTHDENISFERAAELLGPDLAAQVRDASLALYRFAAEHARQRGIIIADTKFEFGLVGDELILIDEALTPDSSRFWPLDGYEPGTGQPSFDKQYVRDYLESIGWHKTAAGAGAAGGRRRAHGGEIRGGAPAAHAMSRRAPPTTMGAAARCAAAAPARHPQRGAMTIEEKHVDYLTVNKSALGRAQADTAEVKMSAVGALTTQSATLKASSVAAALVKGDASLAWSNAQIVGSPTT